MKNYDETIDIVFNRIHQYNTAKSRRKAAITRAAVPVCCACLVALAGIGIFRYADSPVSPIVTDPVHSPVSSVSPNAANDKIIINQLDSIPDSLMDIALMINDFVPMSLEEILAYYGTNVIPTVPSDLSAWEDQRYGIFKRGGGTGEIYWSQNLFQYSNEVSSRNVALYAEKGKLPFSCFLLRSSHETASVINGTEVAIGQLPEDCFYAEFMYKNTGFRLFADGLTQMEFLTVIASLIQ